MESVRNDCFPTENRRPRFKPPPPPNNTNTIVLICSILLPSRVSSNFIFAQSMVAQTIGMKHELQAASTLADLPNELLYAVFIHVESRDLLSLARISRRLNAVAMRLYLGPWREVQKDYSVFGGYSTGTPRNFFALRSLRLSLATPYIPSMTLMFSLNFAEELDEVLRYHRSIPPKHHPSLYIDFTSTTNQCITCQRMMCTIHVERLHRFCEGLVRLRCVSFKCLRTGWECFGEPATSGRKPCSILHHLPLSLPCVSLLAQHASLNGSSVQPVHHPSNP